MWIMHDAHLGRAFLFLEILADYALLSMTIMATLCSWVNQDISEWHFLAHGAV